MILFQNQHLAQERPIVCLELIEIDTTRNGFTEIVSAIPIRRSAPIGVIAFALMTQIQLTDDNATRIVDGNPHVAGVRQMVGYPSFRIERIWIVGEAVAFYLDAFQPKHFRALRWLVSIRQIHRFGHVRCQVVLQAASDQATQAGWCPEGSLSRLSMANGALPPPGRFNGYGVCVGSSIIVSWHCICSRHRLEYVTTTVPLVVGVMVALYPCFDFLPFHHHSGKPRGLLRLSQSVIVASAVLSANETSVLFKIVDRSR